jgi:hypothetical protein
MNDVTLLVVLILASHLFGAILTAGLVLGYLQQGWVRPRLADDLNDTEDFVDNEP